MPSGQRAGNHRGKDLRGKVGKGTRRQMGTDTARGDGETPEVIKV